MESLAKPVLPYPHARNDCILCREMDADFKIVEEALEPTVVDARPPTSPVLSGVHRPMDGHPRRLRSRHPDLP